MVATPGEDACAPELDHIGVERAVAAIIACASSESQAERYAVFTDRYLASMFVGEHAVDQPAFELKIASGVVPEAFSVRLERVSDIGRQPNGRVDVAMHLLTSEGPLTDRTLLAWDADTEAWLIDEVISLDPPPTG